MNKRILTKNLNAQKEKWLEAYREKQLKFYRKNKNSFAFPFLLLVISLSSCLTFASDLSIILHLIYYLNRLSLLKKILFFSYNWKHYIFNREALPRPSNWLKHVFEKAFQHFKSALAKNIMTLQRHFALFLQNLKDLEAFKNDKTTAFFTA